MGQVVVPEHQNVDQLAAKKWEVTEATEKAVMVEQTMLGLTGSQEVGGDRVAGGGGLSGGH